MSLTVNKALEQSKRFESISQTPQLDLEVLLMQVLDCDRAYLYCYSDLILSANQEQLLHQLIERRSSGEPIAYIVGKRAFWNIELIVSKDTLIPRPETELLVELALQFSGEKNLKVVDIGTGSGAIALALANEKPAWTILASDSSSSALSIAKKNNQLKAVDLLQMNWGDALAFNKFDLVLANPPYISSDDPHLLQGDIQFEPKSALVSPEKGLYALEYLIHQGQKLLMPGGWILLEHGWLQGEYVRQSLSTLAYQNITTHQDLAGLDRVTLGQKISHECAVNTFDFNCG